MSSQETALEARRLCVERGKRRVIDDINLRVFDGEVVAILGPNGVGKSTLLRAMCGLLRYQGEVRLRGRSLSELSPRERARQLAFVPQSPSLAAPLPVREVVGHGRYAHARGLHAASPADRAAVDGALKRTDLEAFGDRAFTSLSQGEKQRVMLARALATEARILCLDEPTASLDVAHALSAFHLLRELRDAGYALVVVMHQLADALRFADRAVLMAPDAPPRIGSARDTIAAKPVREVYGVHMRHNAGLEFHLDDGSADDTETHAP